MRHIVKNIALASTFEEWKDDFDINATLIQTLSSSKAIWDWFGANFSAEKSNLKEALLKEQGYICCYCGQEIENGTPTAIEHFMPKSVYKHLMFNYNNLMLSCKCSSLTTPSTILFQQTEGYEHLDILEKIAAKAGCSISKLREFNPVFVGKPKNAPITEVNTGDDLYLFIKHCDDKKGGTDIDLATENILNPLDALVADHFEYDHNGRISLVGVNPVIAENTLDRVLNLNAANLCAKRSQAFSAAHKFRSRLLSDIAAGIMTDDDFLFEQQHQEDTDASGKRLAFCFIYTFVLR
jgi:hypothetical protein